MAVKPYKKGDWLTNLSTNFNVGDFWADPRMESIKLDTNLALILEKFYTRFGEKPRLRNRYGAPATKYEAVTSAGFRTENAGGAQNSKHKLGMAVDFEIPGVSAVKLAQYAETLKEVGGIGLYYYAGQIEKQGHIHIDTRLGRARWGWKGSYSSGGRLPGFGGIPCTFRLKDQSVGVEIIQRWLIKQGYQITADGEFGPKTAEALKDWQKKNGLAADSIYGKATEKVAKVFGW